MANEPKDKYALRDILRSRAKKEERHAKEVMRSHLLRTPPRAATPPPPSP